MKPGDEMRQEDPDTQAGESHASKSWIFASIAIGLLYLLFSYGGNWHWIVIACMVILAAICSTAAIMHAVRGAMRHERAKDKRQIEAALRARIDELLGGMHQGHGDAER